MIASDLVFMKEALKEAKKAFEADEVPVGAVLVYENRVIARGHNQVEQLQDATAHAAFRNDPLLHIGALPNVRGGASCRPLQSTRLGRSRRPIGRQRKLD